MVDKRKASPPKAGFPTASRSRGGLDGVLCLLVVLAGLIIAQPAGAAETSPGTISTVMIYGNRHTSEQIVRLYLGMQSGMPFDSVMIDSAKARLMGLRVFQKVEIFPQYTPAGVRIIVILSELFRWSITTFGGELYSSMYGRSTDRWWWNAHGGITNINFRGKLEQLSISVALPRRWAGSVAWTKPILGTPMFMKVGTGASLYPDLYIPWDRFSVYGFATFGRRIGTTSRVYGSLMPQYGRRWWKGPSGVWDTLAVRDTTSPVVGAPFTNTTYDVTGRDRVVTGMRVGRDSTTGPPDTTWTVAEREWVGNSSALIAQRERPYKELYLILGWSTDHRASGFDISRGYYVGATLLTNALYPRDPRFSYVQLDTDTRFYTPGPFGGHKLALRLRTTMRVDSSDIYDGIYAGGETSIRGYPRGWFPRGFIANNQVLATAEYRFPIVATPPIDIPVFSSAVDGLRQFYYRLDGALIADGGYLWHRLEQPLTPHADHSYGVGLGAGLRLLAPTLQRSGCFDFVWALDHEYNQLKKQFYREQKAAGKRPMPYWIPDWYLYVDMMF